MLDQLQDTKHVSLIIINYVWHDRTHLELYGHTHFWKQTLLTNKGYYSPECHLTQSIWVMSHTAYKTAVTILSNSLSLWTTDFMAFGWKLTLLIKNMNFRTTTYII